MYQVAYGGLVLDGVRTVDNAPNDWYEAGNNLMQPIQFGVGVCDTAYFLIRDRNNSAGTTFFTVDPSNLIVTAVDATTGQELTGIASLNTINTGWDTNTVGFDPRVITITPKYAEGFRARVIDITVTNTVDSKFIRFRALIDDASRPFSYIVVDNDERDARLERGKRSTEIRVKLTQGGSYVILSPSCLIDEVEIDQGDFTYPASQIHYTKTIMYNDEDFDWTIENASHEAIANVVSFQRIPGVKGIIALVIDAYAEKALNAVDGKVTFEVHATSRTQNLSNVDVLTVSLLKRDRLFGRD